MRMSQKCHNNSNERNNKNNSYCPITSLPTYGGRQTAAPIYHGWIDCLDQSGGLN